MRPANRSGVRAVSGGVGSGGATRRRKPAGTARVGTAAQPRDGPTASSPGRDVQTGTRSDFRTPSERRALSGCYSANISSGLSTQEHLPRLGEAGPQVHRDAVAVMDRGGGGLGGPCEDTPVSACSAFLPEAPPRKSRGSPGHGGCRDLVPVSRGPGWSDEGAFRTGEKRAVAAATLTVRLASGRWRWRWPGLTDLPERTARVSPWESQHRSPAGADEPGPRCPWQAWCDSQ